MKLISVITIAVAMMLVSCNGNNPQTSQVQVSEPTAVDQSAVTDNQRESDKSVQPQSLPEPVMAFVKQHFPKAKISYSEADRELGGVEYEVVLDDGTKIEFDVKNQWTQIDCRAEAVPSALVPQNIAAYVNANYQSLLITKIEKEHYGYNIDLSNGVELNFDRSGRFTGLDN